jgi:hypothetical protein
MQLVHSTQAAQQSLSLEERIGLCRHILVEPLVPKRFNDAALESYAGAWGTAGATLRHWLSNHDPANGPESLAPSRVYRTHVEWLAHYEARILALQHDDSRQRAPYWSGLMGESTRSPFPPPRSEGLPPDTAVPAPGEDIAEHYLARIAFWQGQTGQLGLPPRAWNVKLSNYVAWLRTNRGTTASNIEHRLLDLGIRLERGYSSVNAPRDHQDPRGLAENVDACRHRVAGGRVPSLRSESKEDRRLAGWLIRCQAGILSTRHLSENPSDPTALSVAALVKETAAAQTPLDFAVQWHLFAYRVREHVRRATKGDGWAQYACDASLENFQLAQPDIVREVAQLGRGLPDGVTTVSPHGLLKFINARLGSLPRPVTFRLDRPATEEAARRLLDAGVAVSESPQDFATVGVTPQ